MMVAIVLLYIIAALLLYSFYKFTFTRPNNNFPPGPPRLPIWGSYWILLALDYKFLTRALTWLSKKYNSPLVGLYLEDFPAVVVHGRLVKEALNKREFDARLSTILGTLRGEGKKLGKRLCAGETFARQTMFLTAAGLMQNFTFKMHLSVPKLMPGLLTTPERFQVKFFPRD